MLGFYPTNLKVYDIAVIHKSASKVSSRGNYINNERLEYLGDAILGAAIADFLYNRFPNQDEGYLTQMRSKLVNRSFLTQLTYQIGLNHYIQSNTTSTTESSHIYGDTLEALIGAIYLDKGYPEAKKFITRKLLNNYVNLAEVQNTNTNYKSQLIEWSQKNKRAVSFDTADESKNDGKQPWFVASIEVDNQLWGKGTGTSKKEAQQNASKVALEKINDSFPDSDSE
ncbi:MAG: ribonuclease III [Bacteroidetes bacterium GWB2_41_8]|nr:MAG: ribonuclease III [Bacteroidetes bacterium GWB2_41_8]